ncbi:hypothetical protein KKC32_03610, partial [Patescibacteria group bacterium]|nr:hypothetical protein [Patescibacteria group bacterium]
MTDNKTQEKLSPEIDFIWGSGASADANESIAAEFGFSVGQLAKMLRLVKDLFFKEKNISDIDLLLIE